MSGMVLDKGSVVDVQFLPNKERILYVMVWRGPWAGEFDDAYRLWGWITVVTHRSMWVVTTAVEPMIQCCGKFVPVYLHLNEGHKDQGNSALGHWQGEVKIDADRS